MIGAVLVGAERRRQIEVEGYTPEHDAEHGPVMLLAAGAAYQDGTSVSPWPFDASTWRPKGELRNLIRAGALYQAAIDVFDLGGAARWGLNDTWRWYVLSLRDAVIARIDDLLAEYREVLHDNAAFSVMVRCSEPGCGWYAVLDAATALDAVNAHQLRDHHVAGAR